MERRCALLSLVVAGSACADWDALYTGYVPDASFDAPALEPLSDPVVLWDFEGEGRPDTVPDRAPRGPQVTLRLDLSQDPAGMLLEGGALRAGGGLLRVGVADTQSILDAVSRTQGMSIELWIQPERSGAFLELAAASESEGLLVMAVADVDLEVRSRLLGAVERRLDVPDAFNGPSTPLHLVFTFDARLGVSTVSLDGREVRRTAYADFGADVPPLVWADRLELAVARAFRSPTSSYFAGTLWRVAIYDRALDPDTIARLFETGAL